MPFIPREAALARLRARVAAREPIIGAGAGTGITAKFSERGGVDLIIIYNSGRYRMAGRGSLAGLMPYGDANAIVVEMAGEVLPVVTKTPVLAGVNGTDPFRDMDSFLDQLKALGFAGVQNFPTVGLIDGVFRANLEETGMSYALEIDMIAKARDKDMLTTPYVFSESEAAAMAIAGADIIVCHLGLTTGGAIGAHTAGGQAEMADDDVGTRDGHRRGLALAEYIGRRQHVLVTRLGDHVDLKCIGHSGLFEIGAEDTVNQPDGWKILHAGKAQRLQLVQEKVHVAERVGTVDAGEHRRPCDDREHFTGHLHDDGVGVAIGHHAGERAAPGHAIAAGIVDDDQVDAAGFLAFGGKASAGAAANDRFAFGGHGAKLLQDG